MNLVAKEYISSRKNSGVLILSQHAGAAKELTDAIIIDPYNIQNIVVAIKQALEMCPEQQKKSIESMQRHLRQHNIVQWGNDFIHQLLSHEAIPFPSKTQLATKAIQHTIRTQFQKAHHKLFLLDYDGTLRNFTRDPKASKPNQILLNTLFKLAQAPNTRLVIISGRDKYSLEKWLGHIPIDLVSEHGSRIKINGHWRPLFQTTCPSWKNDIILAINERTQHIPNGLIEEKEFGVVWHYRNSPGLEAQRVSKVLERDLKPICLHHDLCLTQGNHIVEVTASSVGKNFTANFILNQDKYDFVLAAGDDTADENLFAALPDNAFSIRVGMGLSKATHRLNSVHEMIQFLNFMSLTSSKVSTV